MFNMNIREDEVDLENGFLICPEAFPPGGTAVLYGDFVTGKAVVLIWNSKAKLNGRCDKKSYEGRHTRSDCSFCRRRNIYALYILLNVLDIFIYE